MAPKNFFLVLLCRHARIN